MEYVHFYEVSPSPSPAHWRFPEAVQSRPISTASSSLGRRTALLPGGKLTAEEHKNALGFILFSVLFPTHFHLSSKSCTGP